MSRNPVAFLSALAAVSFTVSLCVACTPGEAKNLDGARGSLERPRMATPPTSAAVPDMAALPVAAAAAGDGVLTDVVPRAAVPSDTMTPAAAAPDATTPDAGAPREPASAPGGAASADAGASGDAGPTAPSNDCCSTSRTGGCNDPSVLACVCEGDPVCCSGEYDALCVIQAVSRCQRDCDDRPPVSDCCAPGDSPGCTVPEVHDCVCAIDPVCCVLRFDENCVNLGTSQCGAVCGESGSRP